MNPDDPIDQNRLPYTWVWGQRSEEILSLEDLERWAGERASRCGHTGAPVAFCRMCHGTERVMGLFSAGDHVRVFPGT